MMILMDFLDLLVTAQRFFHFVLNVPYSNIFLLILSTHYFAGLASLLIVFSYFSSFILDVRVLLNNDALLKDEVAGFVSSHSSINKDI